MQRVVPEERGPHRHDSGGDVDEDRGCDRCPGGLARDLRDRGGGTGFVATGQALARTALSIEDQIELHALGLSRWQRFAALLLPGALVATVGAAVAGGVALLASPMMPTGLARRVEPDPGRGRLDRSRARVHTAVAILVSGRAAVSAWRTASRPSSASVPAGGAGSWRLARLGAPPPVVTGVRMALQPERGPIAAPVRSGLTGAVAGVAGLVAALTFEQGSDG